MVTAETPPPRRIWPAVAAVAACLVAFAPRPSAAQLPASEERLRILTDPDTIKKTLDKEKTRPPLEMFRSQIAPFDVLPYVKAGHWSTLSLELRANYEDYDGALQTDAVPMLGLPQELIFKRDARLTKTQRSRLGLQIFMPEIPREIGVELIRPDAVRADDAWQASLKTLERQQMLILFLSKDGNDSYALWNRYQALYPQGLDRGDQLAIDKRRYYRLVLPMEPEKPLLSAHPLTWGTVSHVVWDGLSPDALNSGQQEAMLDWLHWGGQLVVVGGPGPSFSLLKDSFLSPYLPGEVTGENALLGKDDLAPLSVAYRPPYVPAFSGGENDTTVFDPEIVMRVGVRYRSPMPITPAADRPVFLAGLRPGPGAVGIPLGESGDRLVGVEKRVGRGRVLMLGLSPTDPALATWRGLDTFVRRVVLRRPEQNSVGRLVMQPVGFSPVGYGPLAAPDLSWVRYLSRDMVVPLPPPKRSEALAARKRAAAASKSRNPAAEDPDEVTFWTPETAVAEWNDYAAVPRLCRTILEDASGIKIPGSGFVLKVLLAYIAAVVPLNWLLCRYVFGRREYAWVIVPALSVAFAVGVERAAAYDLGFNSACDEVDVFESFGGYPRAHVSRFASLYSTGRTRFSIAYPNDQTALALPLDNGRSIRGEDVNTAVWKSYPSPALEGYLVQPRSLAFFRAEQMIDLDGAVSLETDETTGARRLVNRGGLELRDAVLVDYGGKNSRNELYLGTIPPGSTTELKGPAPRVRPTVTPGALDPERVLRHVRSYFEDRPENAGEIRLVAWAESPVAGQRIEPPVDRHRGYTIVVVHLKNGPPPPPNGPHYDANVKTAAAEQVEPPPINAAVPRPGSRRRRPVLDAAPSVEGTADPNPPAAPNETGKETQGR